MLKKILTFILAVIVFSGCNRQSPNQENQNYSGLIGGWYKSTNLERLGGSYSLADLYQVWDGENNHGSSWSGQWEGFITSPVTGKIGFYVYTNQEVRLKINDKEVLFTEENMEKDSVEVFMEEGKEYPVHLIYKQNSVGHDMGNITPYFGVYWSWGKEKDIVPVKNLHYNKEQDNKWNYIGENYFNTFSYLDSEEYTIDPIRIKAPELEQQDFNQSTGGLPVVPGVETYTICRANRENPEKAEGLGYTYQHHQDLAIWKGKMYVGWNTCQVDEDSWPSRELVSTSEDGKTWTGPVEMFPQGISTPIRMYFFLAPNGRLLLIAGLRVSHKPLSERMKSGIVVREIRADHTFGKVYTLRNAHESVPNQPPPFDSSPDKAFVEACGQLLADHLYLSQQDYGNFLDREQQMKWFNSENWTGTDQLKDMAKEFGKGMCFFERKDGVMVALSKFRWVTTSSDGGRTWIQPARPKSLITGWGKVWGQATSDGRYAIIYNPHPNNRWPLLLLTSDDGINFSHPMSVNGQLPEKRYEGKFKDIGVSYHRGLSHWNNDGSWKDDDLWLVYSLNKEDILISKIPVPISE